MAKPLIERRPELFRSHGGLAIDTDKATGLLGKGAYGNVYRAQRHDGVAFAVKFQQLGLVSSNACFTRESEALQHLARLYQRKHAALPTGIVQWFGAQQVQVCGATGSCELYGMQVFNLLPSRLLLDIITERPGLFGPQLVYRYASQLARAVAALHRAGVVHNDIKAENIAVDPATQCLTLFDFGFATVHTEANFIDTATTDLPLCSPLFGPPEILLQTVYGPKGESRLMHPIDPFAVDIWQYGQVCYSMIVGRNMFDHCHTLHELRESMREMPEPLLNKTIASHDLYRALIHPTIIANPTQRVKAARLEAFFDEIKQAGSETFCD